MIDMNSDQVFDAIEAIARTASKNEKEALVKQYMVFPLFAAVAIAAYNPRVTYGIAKVPARDTVKYAPGASVFGPVVWDILARLAKRELTGNAAREQVEQWMQLLSEKSAELLARIIRKDLKAGFTDGTINRAVKGSIKEYPYMRCSLVKDAKFGTWDWVKGAISQEKADGMFANINREANDIVEISSRAGSPFPLDEMGELITEVLNCMKEGTQTHGEFLVELNGVVMERALSNGVMNRIAAGGTLEPGERITFQAWDQIPLDAVLAPKGKCEIPYMSRFKDLVIQVGNAPAGSRKRALRIIETKVVHSLADAYKHYAEKLAQGKEGTIIKNPAAIWKDGTSKDQIKLKLEVDVDLKVVAIVAGKAAGKNEGRAGSLTCVTSDQLLQVDVTVKNEAMRDQVDANPDEWIGKIIAVKANSILAPSESNVLHSLFLPRMVEAAYRTDKSEADSLQRVKDQFASAVKVAT